LSLWEVQDDRSNLQDVIIALATNADHLSNLDYAMVPRDRIGEIASVEETEGKTPHSEANRNWHRDLVGLSGRKLIDIAVVIFSTGELGRVSEKEVTRLIRKAIDEQTLDATRMKVAM